MAAEHEFMTIGEVVEQLKPEYPDLTISKVRFLEDEGLVSPERTSGGYRKFHRRTSRVSSLCSSFSATTTCPLP